MKTLFGIICALVLVTGCASSKVTNIPSDPLYRADGVDFRVYDSIVFEDGEISTSNGTAVDFVKDNIRKAIEQRLKDNGYSGQLERAKTDVPGKTLVIKSQADVYWGNLSVRMNIGFGAGTAHIYLKLRAYDKNDPAIILAKMDYHDATTFARSDDEMVVVASKKASQFFINEVLKLEKAGGG